MSGSDIPLRRADDVPEVGLTLHEMVLRHDRDIRALQDTQLVMLTTTRTILRLLAVTLGTSVMGVILMLANLGDLLRIGVR